MRVTEARLMAMATRHLNSAREEMGDAQTEVSGGVRVARPSDDPTAWAIGRRAEARSIAESSRASAIGMARDRAASVDAALSSLTGLLMRAKELGIQGGNATLNAGDRQVIADEVRALASESISLANTVFVDGEYLLAGSLGGAAPFSPAGAYAGDASQREIEIAPSAQLAMNVPGSRLSAASGVDVLASLENLALALESGVTTGISASIDEMDAAITQTTRARSEMGALDAALRTADEASQDRDLVLAEVRARSIDSDPVEAALRLSAAATSLSTAQAVSSKIVSLLNS